MKENDYLNPDNLRGQCDAAVMKLLKDNAATYAVEKNLDTFIGNGQIISTAFQALKQQISDYKTVLQAMRTANQSDIDDFMLLKLRLGNQELNGAVILEQKESALAAKKSDEKNAEKYRQKARNERTLSLRLYYSNKVAVYKAMAEADQNLYHAWQEKENRYNEIEGCTSGLFTNGAAMRAAAENALNSIKGAFQNGKYVPDMGAEWRSEIYDIYFNRVFTISQNGELKINMREVEKILSKDSGTITDGEYDVLALAYLLAEEEDLPIFVQNMMGNKEDYDYSLLEQWIGYAAYNTKEDYSEWKIDQEKINQIRSRIAGYAEGTLRLIQEYRTNGESEAVSECVVQRNNILQRMTLLNVINEIGVFRGGYEAEYPIITIKHSENGALVLGFREIRNIGSQVAPSYTTLGESTVTIRGTINGTAIDNKEIEYSEYVLTNYFGAYSFINEAVNFTMDEIEGQMIGSVFEHLSEKIVQRSGNKILGNVIGYVPVVGDVAEFAVDTVMNENQAKQDVEFIREQFNAIHAAEVYSDYDCCVNLVEYDMEEHDCRVIYPYAGEKTDSKIELVNNELSEVLSTEITRETILRNPESIWEFEQALENDKERKNLYDEIIANKREKK